MNNDNTQKGAEEMPLTKDESKDLDAVCDQVLAHRVTAMKKRLKAEKEVKAQS